ncbi:glycosyl hydrolase 115 family protein [Flavobacterium cellulosilyticum]|uniref:Glycosyl hydrolase n=1 Tax=Flavobacterium cellulosilyticum TaxID=2541731 RepID=A0A4R5CIB3_9FLAO|nr:glycosyl hydrolase 115 family protein [Flavobacterium cellulosilyticum]TDD99515.1 glycosyl hydrolase [Flavobacterium cellulosilyticum]
MKNSIKKYIYCLLFPLLVLMATNTYAINPNKYVTNSASKGSFPIASKGKLASIVISDNDYGGVLRVVGHLENDIFAVTNLHPNRIQNNKSGVEYAIIIGTLGHSTIIDQLAKEGKINPAELHGKWEKFTTQIVENPTKSIKRALVIAGSDKRGTIYGIYDLSSQIGVSPWHFWADVPAKKQSELHALSGIHSLGEPKVKYRGIFINDEAPALTGWVRDNYGKFNAKFYDTVFELILRMKGNYLWPAMWSEKFYADDPQNGILADEYGIVMGTSHHEPLAKAHGEWNKAVNGAWDFNKNPEGLKKFWTEGMQRMGNKETMVTIGMRGDGDEPMTEGTAISLLENIVKTQREIISSVTKKPADQTPQMWALYKEVQDYYDKGMQVPDDVTLLLCDDNWGNLRKLPELDAKPRKGGYGIYYHFDYVGGPRSYKWINTNQIERTWEQMHLAYEHDVNQIWIVNVGDIKPVEFPLEFFMDYAWNPEAWNAGNLQDYYTQWASANFGEQNATAIATLLKMYSKYNARKKPELLNATTYSLTDYNEAETAVSEYNALAKKAQEVNNQLPAEFRDAFYQLVLYPVLASANLHELNVAVAKNSLYASQGRAATNNYATKVKTLFDNDAELSDYYNTTMANGKWNHMMSQTHIGYTIWSDPKTNIIPATKTISIPSAAEMGVTIEGTTEWWPNATEESILPAFNSLDNTSSYIDIFNRGTKPFDFSIFSKSDWIKFSKSKGAIDQQERIKVGIIWEKAPQGTQTSTIVVSGNGKSIPILIKIINEKREGNVGFVENNGFIAIDAEHYADKTEPETYKWETVENLGKTNSSVISLPIKKGRVELNANSPKLSYNVNFKNTGTVKVSMYFSPTINYSTREGMYFGLSFDKENPVKVNYDSDPYIFDYNGKVPKYWDKNVSESIKVVTTEFKIATPGNHILNYYRIDEGLVLQKIIIETEKSELKKTNLGPPENFNIKN